MLNEKYVSVSRKLLEDRTVSLKAKGLYALISSQPLHWDNSILALVEASGEGRHIVCTALNELEQTGYLERHQIKENGRFCGMEYELKEG